MRWLSVIACATFFALDPESSPAIAFPTFTSRRGTPPWASSACATETNGAIDSAMAKAMSLARGLRIVRLRSIGVAHLVLHTPTDEVRATDDVIVATVSV